MTRGLSLWLDWLRVLATLVVVFSHLAYPRFTETRYAFMRDWNLGSDAVIVFFVISGLVIAFAAERDGSAGRFAFNRTTRLFSVLAPALVLTLAFDAMGVRIDPASYPQGFYNPHPTGEFLIRGLTFSNEWALPGALRLGTNGPLWSLSYEAAYYLLFGVAMFLRGITRLIVLVTICLVVGLNILLLAPAWLMGVLVWRWIAAGGATRLTRGRAWAMALMGPAAYVLCLAAGIPDLLRAVTAATLDVPDARLVLRFSDEFIWNMMIGAFTACHIVGMAVLAPARCAERFWLRWAAGASFSIYVTHYPTLHLVDAMLPDQARYDGVLFAVSLVVGLAFAAVFERPIAHFRRVLMRLHTERTRPQTVDQTS
ncbi:MAG: acyltransferase [Pseudomonadota bacterium]